MQLQPNVALIVIDVQQGFDLDPAYWGERNNPTAEANMQRLLNRWRQSARPIYHTKHNSTNPQSPLHPTHTGNQFKLAFMPADDEIVIEKDVNSAFIGTDLEQRLRDADIDQLVMIGLTTDHCVNTTTRMAGNLGFETYLVHDATATHARTGYDGTHYDAQTIHEIAIASLKDEFATIVDTATILKALEADD